MIDNTYTKTMCASICLAKTIHVELYLYKDKHNSRLGTDRTNNSNTLYDDDITGQTSVL